MFNYRIPPKDWIPFDIKLANLKFLLEKAEKTFLKTKEKWMELNPSLDYYDYSFEDMQKNYDEVCGLEEEIKSLLKFIKA